MPGAAFRIVPISSISSGVESCCTKRRVTSARLLGLLGLTGAAPDGPAVAGRVGVAAGRVAVGTTVLAVTAVGALRVGVVAAFGAADGALEVQAPSSRAAAAVASSRGEACGGERLTVSSGRPAGRCALFPAGAGGGGRR